MDFTTKNFLCTRCGLHKHCVNPHLNGRGNINSKILVLGEAPGKDEDLANAPFVGISGSLLQTHLSQLEIDCYIDNSVSCRPSSPDGANRTPTPLEIECCRAFTMELILKMKPKVIIAVGKIAMVQLLKLGMGIEVARGQKFYIPEISATVVPTYHPSYLLRTNDSQLFNEFVSDLRLAKQISELPQSRTIKSKPTALSDPVKIKNYLTELIECPSFSLDLETTGLNHRDDRITDISFCKTLGEGVTVSWEDLMEFNDLFKILLKTDNEKIFHNAHFDLMFLRQCGYEINKKIFDTMLAYHMLNMKTEGGAGNSLFALDTLSWLLTTEGGYKSILSKYGGIKAYQDSIAEEEDEESEKQMEMFNSSDYTVLDGDAITPYDKYLVSIRDYLASTKEARVKELGLTPGQYYSAMDSDVTFRVAKNLKTVVDKNNSELFYGIIMPLCRALVEVRMNGIKLDFAYMNKVKLENDTEIEKIKAKFFKKIGYEFNMNSSKEVGDLMYNKMGLIPNKKYTTKKGKKPAANEDAIVFYSEQKPILKSILDYRYLQKQNSTYLVGLQKQADHTTHRYYPEYKQLTVTGRLSSPIHTIPKENKIRGIIIPEKGNKLVLADLSQIELRMLAFLAKDKNMTQAFEDGQDFHTYTACEFNGIKISDFDKKNPAHSDARSAAKSINFGIAYLISAESLAEDITNNTGKVCSVQKAQMFMNKFFASYPGVSRFIQETIAFAQRFGYVETLYGRRRYLPKILSVNEFMRAEAERRAVNTRIQGTAGDITNMAVIKLQNWLEEREMKSKIVATIHDSIMTECPEDEIYDVSRQVVEFLTIGVPKVGIKLKADLDIQERWQKD